MSSSVGENSPPPPHTQPISIHKSLNGANLQRSRFMIYHAPKKARGRFSPPRFLIFGANSFPPAPRDEHKRNRPEQRGKRGGLRNGDVQDEILPVPVERVLYPHGV